MNFKKIRYVTFLVLVILFGLCSIAYAAPLKSADLISILPEKSGSELTRAEFGAMLVEAANLELSTKEVQMPTDLQTDSWYASYIKTLIATDILRGFADGSIKPEKAISQSEAVVMIARTLGIPEITSVPGMTVNTTLANGHWAYNTYNWMVSEGLVEKVNSNEILTPETGAELLVRVFGTEDQCQEINEKIESANASITSLRMTGNIDMQMNAQNVNENNNMPSNMQTSVSMQSEIVMDKGLHIIMETSVPVNNETKEFVIEQYMTDAGIFINMPDPATNESTWKKIPNDMFPNLMDLIKQQSNPFPEEIKKMFYFRYLGEEKLGEKEVIKLAFYGEIKDMAKIMASLGQLNSQLQQTISQTGGLLKSITYLGKMYIDKETYLPLQVKNFSVVEYAEQYQGKPFPIKSILANYDFTYSDFNAELDIILPEEAQNAEELDLTPPAN